MRSTLSEEVELHCQFLATRGVFSKVEDIYEPLHFGNAVVTLTSNALTVRFISDRGDISCEIGSAKPGHKTWDIALIMALIGKRERTEPVPSIASVPQFAGILQTHLDILTEAFSDEVVSTTENALQDLARIRAGQILKQGE
jgi:hypothetical protein